MGRDSNGYRRMVHRTNPGQLQVSSMRRIRQVQSSQATGRSSGDGQYVYLVEAQGFHGILSALIKRRKIGLTNNPSRRLSELNSSQAPCPIAIIKVISVTDNARVESELHSQFRRNRKHGEWFDFWVWELPLVAWMYSRKEDGSWVSRLSMVSIAIALAGVASLAIAHPFFKFSPSCIDRA